MVRGTEHLSGLNWFPGCPERLFRRGGALRWGLSTGERPDPVGAGCGLLGLVGGLAGSPAQHWDFLILGVLRPLPAHTPACPLPWGGGPSRTLTCLPLLPLSEHLHTHVAGSRGWGDRGRASLGHAWKEGASSLSLLCLDQTEFLGLAK